MSDPVLDPALWLDLIIAKSAEMRAAGVTTITVGNCSVNLAPIAVVTAAQAVVGPTATKPAGTNYDMNPLEDPALYGGSLPGFDLSGVAKLIKEIEHD